MTENTDVSTDEGATYIRSLTEPFDLEMELKEEQVKNWFTHFGILKKDQDWHQLHVSGHGDGTQIKKVIDGSNSKKLIPIHTQHDEYHKKWHSNVVSVKQHDSVDLCTNQGFKSIICNTEKILPEFLYYYLLSAKPLLQTSGTTSNYTEINLTKLKKFLIPIPKNIKDQENIIEKLNMILKYFESKEREILDIQGNNGNMIDDLDDLRSLILGVMFPKNDNEQ